MKSNELIECITTTNPEGGNKIIGKYLRKQAKTEAQMKDGLNAILKKGGNAVLTDFIIAMPAPGSYSNCEGCDCKCGKMNADGERESVITKPVSDQDFLHKHGGVIALSIAAIAIVYIASKNG